MKGRWATPSGADGEAPLLQVSYSTHFLNTETRTSDFHVQTDVALGDGEVRRREETVLQEKLGPEC